MKKIALVLAILVSSCVVDKGKIKVSTFGSNIFGAKSQMDKVSLNSVSISNNQLVLVGSGFSGIKNLLRYRRDLDSCRNYHRF